MVKLTVFSTDALKSNLFEIHLVTLEIITGI
jgi:hypothetical protein